MTTEMEKALRDYCETIDAPYEETRIAAEYIDQHFSVIPEALRAIAVEAQWTLQHNVDSYGCDYEWVYGPDGLDFILHDQFTIPAWAKTHAGRVW